MDEPLDKGGNLGIALILCNFKLIWYKNKGFFIGDNTVQQLRDHAFEEVDWENVIKEIESLG